MKANHPVTRLPGNKNATINRVSYLSTKDKLKSVVHASSRTEKNFCNTRIFTMKNTVFRRDEIWFAALDEKHSSQIYSLYEIRREDNERVNSTAAFDKQYLEGRYGADPYLQNMLCGGEWI